MDGGGLGELIGAAAVGVGVVAGRLYGPQAEKRFDRIVNRVLVATLVGTLALLLPFVIWWAVTS
jgi:Na+-driven multidrug efflux pump